MSDVRIVYSIWRCMSDVRIVMEINGLRDKGWKLNYIEG